MIGLLHSLLSQDLDRIERQLGKGNKSVWEDLRHIADILEDLIKLTIFDDIHTKNLHVPHNVFRTTVDRTDSTDQSKTDLERGDPESRLIFEGLIL